ncbi:MAG: hypothetical protein ACMG6H_09800 [Acidobacteriota bacterium]
MNMNITFPRTELRDHVSDPVEFLVDVDGKRVRAEIDLSTLAALNPAGHAGAGAMRDFVMQKLGHIERTIEAHILARGIPPNRVIVIDLAELRARLA